MSDEARKIVAALRVVCGKRTCDDCPCSEWCHRKKENCLDDDAADLIEKLIADRDEWKRRAEAAETWERKYKEVLSRLETTTQERDAAVKDIPRSCGYCKHFIVTHNGCTPDYDCAKNGCMNVSGINTGWEWRGVQDNA